jgi:hypothetical protein
MKFYSLSAVLAIALLCPSAHSQESKTFPTDDEIKLVVTQTERALVDYASTIQQEEKVSGKRIDVETDKRLTDALTTATKVFGVTPRAFNSPVGFEFVMMLDDASRNAALCNAGAMSEGLKATLAGQTQAGEDYLRLAQACTSVSTLLYTVSENAAALYQRYVNGEQDLAQQTSEEMTKCVAVLKQQKPK